MEHAFFMSKKFTLESFGSKFTRIYLGNEFCEYLIPSSSEIENALNFCLNNSINFTLVTPLVTEKGLNKIAGLLEFMDKNFTPPAIEIVINDWGTLELLRENKYRNFTPVLGRLLNNQERGPRILNVWSHGSKYFRTHFRSTGMDSRVSRQFLIKHGISRIELDNLLQGIERDSNISASLYYPFVYVSTTRACYSNSFMKRKRPPNAIYPCNRECLRHSFLLKNPDFPVDLLVSGNTIFFQNETVPGNLKKYGIDRLVYQPVL